MINKYQPIVITCGDPAGVGPEVAISAWKALKDEIPLCILIDPNFLPKNINIKILEQPPLTSDIERNSLTVIRQNFVERRTPGKPNPKHAESTIEVIKRGVQFVKDGQCSAICTMPISKAMLKVGANFPFPGHTEYLAHLDGSKNYAMMLVNKYLRVVPVTIHIPVKDITKYLNAELIKKTIKTTHQELNSRFSISNPNIWISGLNPHAGENGTIGDEEQKFIIPTIKKLQSEGYNLLGPLSADTMFYGKKRPRFDAAICMYHDQALIPIKTLDFHSSVNLTIGLSFIRTSPDHGTAFDIAGKNLANPTSTIEAIKLAWNMAKKEQKDR
ncbi:4-hydroxythreonine-4-phosphate dehydrogenase PdxA [Rhodobacteraceae bacterium]|nr:4-hydroxythreonine-4-phosphate dehydrogenase PdxA [Paracoccaceae bacterium]